MSKIRCTTCNKVLSSNDIVELELSITDGRYYDVLPPKHESQGYFPFELKCAVKELCNTTLFLSKKIDEAYEAH